MLKIFMRVDKHQRVKYLLVKLHLSVLNISSSNVENSFVNNFKTADYSFELRVTIVCKPAWDCAAFNLK